MKDNIKTVYEYLENVTDSETGEVLEQKTKKIELIFNPDDFCLVYAGMWNAILNSPLSKSDIELFAYLVQQYAKGVPFTISRYIKEQVSLRTKKKITSYNNSVKSLLENKMIFQVAKQTYKVNPRYAFEGSSKDRNKAVIEMVSKCKDC